MVWTTAADSIDQNDATKKKELPNVQKHFGFETSGDVSTTLHMVERLVMSAPGCLLRCCKLGFHGSEGDEVNTKFLRHGQKQEWIVEPRPETGQVQLQLGLGGAHSHGGPFQLEDDVSCFGGMSRSLRMRLADWSRPSAITEDDVEKKLLHVEREDDVKEKQLHVERDDVPYAHVRVLRERNHVHPSEFSITGDGVAHDSTDTCVYSPEYMTMVLHSVAKAGDEEHDQGRVRVLNKKGHAGTGDVSTNEDGVPPVFAGPLDTFVPPPDHFTEDGEVGDVEIAKGDNIDGEDGHREGDDEEYEDEEDEDEEDEDEEDEDEEDEDDDDADEEEIVNLGSAGNPIVVGNLSSSDFEAIVFDLCPLLP